MYTYNMQEFEPNTCFQWKMDQYDWLNLSSQLLDVYYNSVHVYIECWYAWVTNGYVQLQKKL